MGFFGELKQDLSQVAGDAKKKSEAESEAEQILAEAELVGLDEADAALSEAADEAAADDSDDVSSLLKDLVSDLGGEDLHAEDIEADGESTDIEEDLDAILAGLNTDEIVTESASDAMPGGLEDALAEFESLTDSPESETVIELPDEKPAFEAVEEATAEPEAEADPEAAAEPEAVSEDALAEVLSEESFDEVEELAEEITEETADIPDEQRSR